MDNPDANTIGNNQLLELSGILRCEPCVTNDRICVVKKELEFCLACTVLNSGEECVFTRTVTRAIQEVAHKRSYSWREMGAEDSLQHAPENAEYSLQYAPGNAFQLNTSVEEAFPYTSRDVSPTRRQSPLILPDDNDEPSSSQTTKPNTDLAIIFEEFDENGESLERRRGRRRGPLSPEVLGKSTRLRTMGACWMCRLLKMAVSFMKINFHQKSLQLLV